MHHSSPASHSEFSRLKLLVSYRPSCVSEIEYYRSVDAVLFLDGSFAHSPAYWGPSITTGRRRFRRIVRMCHSSNIFTSRRPFRIKGSCVLVYQSSWGVRASFGCLSQLEARSSGMLVSMGSSIPKDVSGGCPNRGSWPTRPKRPPRETGKEGHASLRSVGVAFRLWGHNSCGSIVHLAALFCPTRPFHFFGASERLVLFFL